MKTIIFSIALFLNFSAISQTSALISQNSYSEVQKAFVTESKIPAPLLRKFENFIPAGTVIRPELPLFDKDGFERGLKEKNSYHLTIEKVRETLNLLNEEALLDSVLVYRYFSAEDSILIEKVYHEYNEFLHRCSFKVYFLDTLTHNWNGVYREDFYPDENGRDTLIISYNESLYENSWEPQSKRSFRYDSRGNRILYMLYTWNSHYHIWSGEYKQEAAYDDDNRQILSAFYSWDYYRNKWSGNYKTEQEFDTNGNVIMDAEYQWNNSNDTWTGYHKITQTYSDEGIPMTTISYIWNLSSNTWELFGKEENLSNHTDSCISSCYSAYVWNTATSQWELEYEVKSDFYINEDKYSVVTRMKQESSEEISNYLKEEVWMNDQGYTVQQNTFLWNRRGNQWAQEHQVNTFYDEHNREIETIGYFKKDTFITGTMIYSLDSTEDIEFVVGDFSCQEKDCLTADTLDFVEGKGALLWNYDARGMEDWGGFSLAEMHDLPDLSGDDGVSLFYKIIIPTNARFNLIFIESSGEEWRTENYDVLSDISSDWKQWKVSFDELFIPPYRETINGVFERDKIDRILFELYTGWMTFANGSLLIDNFTGYIQEKAENFNIYSRNVKIYDDKGKLVADSSFYWNDYLNKLTPNSYTESTYNAFGNRTSSELYFYDVIHEKWIGEFKNTSTFDGRNFLTSSTDYNWNSNKMEWFTVYKKTIKYNDIGLETLTETYSFNWYLQKLTGESKHELTYNTSNKKTSESTYSWEINQQCWIGLSRTEWDYNQQNELINTSYYQWDYETSSWISSYSYPLEEYTYRINERGDIELTIITSWNKKMGQWLPSRKLYYFYKTITGVEFIENNNLAGNFKIYPNPADEILNLQLKDETEATVTLIDFMGKPVKTITVNSSSTTIPVIDLSPGMYIFRLETKNGAGVQKLIIR